MSGIISSIKSLDIESAARVASYAVAVGQPSGLVLGLLFS